MGTLKPFGRTHDGAPFRLHLCDSNQDVSAALAGRFLDIDAVEVLLGDLLDLE